MLVTALIHSILGERRLIGPLLLGDDPLMKRSLARQVVRYAWHFTSVLMALSAAVVVWPDVPTGVLQLTGLVWLLCGIADAVLTKYVHPGWPFLVASGTFTLIGSWI